MQNTLWMLLGAALVSLGVLASALADRIRGLRISRDAAPRERPPRASAPAAEPASRPRPITVVEAAEPIRTTPKLRPARPAQSAASDGGDDVVAALVAAGYRKAAATEATWACTAAERATIEQWTASALRRCARGGIA